MKQAPEILTIPRAELKHYRRSRDAYSEIRDKNARATKAYHLFAGGASALAGLLARIGED